MFKLKGPLVVKLHSVIPFTAGEIVKSIPGDDVNPNPLALPELNVEIAGMSTLFINQLVPRDRIELSTPGFSDRCSTLLSYLGTVQIWYRLTELNRCIRTHEVLWARLS